MCDYRTVEIERGVGGSFGFSIIGGSDTELPPLVCALVHNGSAQLSGKVHVGDVLIEVNGECVTRLPAKKVVEAVKLSPDVLRLRLRKDPEAIARARPFLRRHSVQDPKLLQFQGKVRRTASLPNRAKRPVPRTQSDLGIRKDRRPAGMSTGRVRIVGEPTSPTGIDKGTDGTFRRRQSSRSGSFSKLTTSFPAHGGPPCTVENTQRISGRARVFPAQKQAGHTRTFSEAQKRSLHSSSLPEMGVLRVKECDSSSSDVWLRSSRSADGIARRGSLTPTAEKVFAHGSNNNQLQKKRSVNSLTSDKIQTQPRTLALNSSPYPFRKFHNSIGSLAINAQTGSQHELGPRDAKSNSFHTKNKESALTNSDLPSDELAKRLFLLDGYESTDIAPLLSKNDDFSKAVAVQFMKYFDFKDDNLVESLRKLLSKFDLTGETQERERILIPFSNRYYECNKPEYGSADAVHTLVCAILLLNTDLHGEQTLGRRMKQAAFIKNLSALCDGKDYPIALLKDSYSSIKSNPLEFHSARAMGERTAEPVKTNGEATTGASVAGSSGGLALMGYQTAVDDVVYKEGLLYRKLIEEAGGKKTSAWKRNWQPFCATLRGMILYLHKPEEAKNFDDTRFSTGVHHSFASPALDYRKKPAVFRLITADWKVMLFQARDKTDMLGWVEGLNLVAASFSSPPLPAPVGSIKKFQKPVLPFSRTRLTLTQQLASHEKKAEEMANVLIDHLKNQPHSTDTRQRDVVEWMEKRDFYDYEYKRYRSYANTLKSSKLQAQLRDRSTRPAVTEQTKRNGLLGGNAKRYSSLNDLLDAVDGEQKSTANYRQSYFMAIYRG